MIFVDRQALRSAGLGLWLLDHSSLRRVLEELPRRQLRRQGQELRPDAVALWYALLGKRSVLAQRGSAVF